MADATQQMRREEARRKVRGYLAERPAVALRAMQIVRGLNAGDANDFTEEEVLVALVFLHGIGQLARIADTLGSTPHWQITTDGTLAHERDPLS